MVLEQARERRFPCRRRPSDMHYLLCSNKFPEGNYRFPTTGESFEDFRWG